MTMCPTPAPRKLAVISRSRQSRRLQQVFEYNYVGLAAATSRVVGPCCDVVHLGRCRSKTIAKMKNDAISGEYQKKKKKKITSVRLELTIS